MAPVRPKPSRASRPRSGPSASLHTSSETSGANTEKKVSALWIAAAVLLGIWSGSLPWLSPLNIFIILILTFFRIPWLWFLLAFATAKILVEKYLVPTLNGWGLLFLTSASTIDLAQEITSAPVLSFMNFNDTRVCGSTLFGLGAGTLLALLVGSAVLAFRRNRKQSP